MATPHGSILIDGACIALRSAKVELAVGKGKKSYDKRESIAKRDADRAIQRALRQR